MIKKLPSNWFSFETKYKLLLWKSYVDTGLGQTNYMKYFVITILVGKGLDSIAYGAVIYAVICYLIGWAFYKYKWVEAQSEVSNRFNLLSKELRAHIKKQRKI